MRTKLRFKSIYLLSVFKSIDLLLKFVRGYYL
jgi:hypothetical protein